MVDAGIGRLLVASLHQGIADVAPTRLDFYENWLSPTGMRDGRLSVAPLAAVLSFVQREEAPNDRAIPMRAGECAAEWTFAERPAFRNRVTRRMPLPLRSRSALGLGRGLVHEAVSRVTVKTRLRRGHGTVEIRSPIFEYLREPALAPLRRYFAAAYSECFRLCDIDAVVDTDETAPGCRLTLAIAGTRVRLTPEST